MSKLRTGAAIRSAALLAVGHCSITDCVVQRWVVDGAVGGSVTALEVLDPVNGGDDDRAGPDELQLAAEPATRAAATIRATRLDPIS